MIYARDSPTAKAYTRVARRSGCHRPQRRPAVRQPKTPVCALKEAAPEAVSRRYARRAVQRWKRPPRFEPLAAAEI